MPKRQIVTTTREMRDDPDEREAPPVVPSDQELTWAAFKGKFSINKGARVKVYRDTPKGRQYCFTDPPEKIDEEVIRLHHCKQPNANEATDYYLALEIDGQLQEPFCVPIAPQVATPGVDMLSSGNGGMAQVITLLQQQNERLEQRWMNQERTPMTEMIDAMYKLDQMRGGQNPAANNLDTIVKVFELGQKMGGNAPQEWWQVLLEAVKENGPLLEGVLVRMMPQNRPPVDPGQQVGVIQTEAPPVAEPAKPAQEFKMNDDKERQMLFQTIQFLNKKALKQADPGLYVDLVLDNPEDPIYARLLSEIADKDFSTFAAIDPDIEKSQYRGFFCAIYDGLRSSLIRSDTLANHSNGKNGNTSNTPANGATGKTGRK
jgi:hypothetical protein